MICISLITLVIPPAFAGGRTTRASPAPKYEPLVISTVTGYTITVTEQKTIRAFTRTQFTESIVNGQRAILADLKPGMTVNVSIGADPTHASRIDATGAPTNEKHKKK